MEADVSYNDLVGTIAVDITDHGTQTNQLSEALSDYGFDSEGKDAVGISFYNGYNSEDNTMEFDVIYRNRKEDNKLYKKEISMSVGAFFTLFKRINIILTSKYDGVSEEVDHIDKIERDEDKK